MAALGSRVGVQLRGARGRGALGASRAPAAPPARALALGARAEEVMYTAVGRRKCSTCTVKVVPGTGIVTFNERDAAEYLQFNPDYISKVKDPLEILGLETRYDVHVHAKGGGLTGQSTAARLAISRALCEMDAENRPALKAEGYLTVDARVKERKKYGLRGARRKPQYSKR